MTGRFITNPCSSSVTAFSLLIAANLNEIIHISSITRIKLKGSVETRLSSGRAQRAGRAASTAMDGTGSIVRFKAIDAPSSRAGINGLNGKAATGFHTAIATGVSIIPTTATAMARLTKRADRCSFRIKGNRNYGGVSAIYLSIDSNSAGEAETALPRLRGMTADDELARTIAIIASPTRRI